jgi:DNA invertase Pin-like site-specific DNA recombinase
MLTVLGSIAEFERELIRIRTTEGRARAVAMGVRLGRPAEMNLMQREEAYRRKLAGDPVEDIARAYNVSASTISRLQVGSDV